MSGEQPNVLYREVQRPRHMWLIGLVVIVIAAVFWWGLIQQIILGTQFGDKPAPDWILIIFWILFGIVFPLGTFKVKQITEVREDGIYIRFIPFHFQYRIFPIQDVRHFRSITYSSIGRFGGWGIRINLQGERAYNMGGKHGIELKLSSGTIIVIGTQKPDELEKVLYSINQY
ncbi:DUF6141 family protein [Virgibacillus necropolis]|uniref:DUF6141 family protein n=1 Tax=Virgibacillus necropolis TaxID=163877 RepID=UPI00384D96F0